MTRKLIAALAATAAAGLAVPAFAGNLSQPKVEAPVAQPAPVAAAPMMTGDWTGAYAGLSMGYNHATTSPSIGSGSSGQAGIFGGYNYQFGRYVVGGEVGVNKAHANWGGNTLKTSYDAKLRGGVDLGKAMVYGTVGAKHAQDVHGVGTILGAGVDYKLTDRIILGGEADFTRWNNADNAGTDLKDTTLTARVAFKF